MVEMYIFGLALDEHSQTPILILKDKQEKYVLPIWIGALEAMAISLALNKVDMPRPMTHDLLINIINKLGGKLERVELISLREGVYYADLVLNCDQKEIKIDCRPSDAIALALRDKVSIVALPKLLEDVGTGERSSYQAVLEGDDAEKWTEVLAKYNLDNIKYKM